MRLPYTKTIVVARNGGRDQWGDAIPSIQHEIAGVILYPQSSDLWMSAVDFYETGTISVYNLIVPPDADLVSTDRVRLPGEPMPGPGSNPYFVHQWSVMGAVGWWESPLSGARLGGQVQIQRGSHENVGR